MGTVQNGDRIQVHYTGKFEDGDVFDTSEGGGPLEFEVGAGQLIPGFDTAVVGMQMGEKKQVTLPPEEAYGERSEERVVRADKDQLPPDTEVSVGDVLQVTIDGVDYPAPVTEVDEGGFTIDLNPPLAGRTLVFEIEVVGIVATD
jgi:FKBP-type peptidyl-prolyl cis-trans isomerase 2